MQMQETKVVHDDEEENLDLSRDDVKPLVKSDTGQQVDREEGIMDPATMNPGDPLGVDNVVEPVLKSESIESDGGGDDAKKQVGCQSEDGSGTDSQISEPSIKGQETEPIEGLDDKCDITTSQVSEVAQESERGFSGFDLNEEFCSEEKPESSLSGTQSNSKQRSVCLDIDLNVPDDNEDKDVIISEESSVDASPWKSTRLHLDLNTSQSMSQSCSSSSSSSSKQPLIKNFDLNSNMSNNAASLDHQKPVISLFGTQLEVNQTDNGPHLNGRILEPASKAGWVQPQGSFTPGPSMYYHLSPYRPLVAPNAYIVDPRVVPIAPQFAAPLVMNMAGGTFLGPTGAGSLQQNMGLNLGLMVNGGNSSGSSGSLVGGKRQEPDGGWEGFPVNYKHQQPWK